MDIDGTTSITVAFSLSAVERLADPADVIDSVRRWSDNIGIVTERSHAVVSDFVYEYQLTPDFTSGPRTLEDALDGSKKMLPVDRNIFIGTTDEHESIAEDVEWEYLSIEKAATEAEWELTNGDADIEYDGDFLEIEEQITEDATLDVPMITLRWHQINRGEKDWIVRPVDDDFNADTVTEDRVVLLHRGLAEGHQLWGVIQDVQVFEEVPEIIDDIPFDQIRPHADEEEVVDRMQDTLGDHESYIAFQVKTINPDDHPEMFNDEAEPTQ